jgi:hypothetical protein
MVMSKKQLLLSPKGRVGFPNVFKEGTKPDGSPSGFFDLFLIFPDGADLDVLKVAYRAAVKEKWGSTPPKTIDFPPIFNNEDSSRAKYDGFNQPGFHAKFKKKVEHGPPGVCDRTRTPIFGNEVDLAQSFYGGCWAHVTFVALAWENQGKCGVNFWLSNIQKLDDDEPFGGRTSIEDDFDVLDATPAEIAAGDDEDESPW